jgi:hypothetical protein
MPPAPTRQAQRGGEPSDYESFRESAQRMADANREVRVHASWLARWHSAAEWAAPGWARRWLPPLRSGTAFTPLLLLACRMLRAQVMGEARRRAEGAAEETQVKGAYAAGRARGMAEGAAEGEWVGALHQAGRKVVHHPAGSQRAHRPTDPAAGARVRGSLLACRRGRARRRPGARRGHGQQRRRGCRGHPRRRRARRGQGR